LFKPLSLSSKLSIVNKLISKKFKLGEQILIAGQVPQGLYIVKEGYCKVGLVMHRPHELKGQELAWYRPKVKNLRYANAMLDPTRHMPVQRDKREKIEPSLNLMIEDSSKKTEQFVAQYQRVQNKIREKIYSGESHDTRKRYFSDRFEVLDEQGVPFENGQTLLKKFFKFFDLGPRTYFGGRVLIAESSVTTDGKEKGESGQDKIPMSQLSVVAESAEVEVLIFDKSEIAFFPEDVQREIVIGLRKT